MQPSEQGSRALLHTHPHRQLLVSCCLTALTCLRSGLCFFGICVVSKAGGRICGCAAAVLLFQPRAISCARMTRGWSKSEMLTVLPWQTDR